MLEKSEKILLEKFKGELHDSGINFELCIIYGSQCVVTKKSNSDLDVLFISEDETQYSIIEKFILYFHNRNKLKLDNEVPYKNKLFYSTEEVETFLSSNPLVSGSRLLLSPVKKDASFLNSGEIKIRLLLNAMTSIHIAIIKNEKLYNNLFETANRYIFQIIYLNNKERIDKYLLNKFIFGPNKEKGDFYLGYRGDAKSKKHILGMINDKMMGKKENND